MKLFRRLGALAVVALPLALLADLGENFYYDWHNHQWFIGYFGEYFRQHGTMPTALNIEGAVGMPQPVFYGFLLYPALGLLSAAMGASLTIRVAALAAYLVQFAAVYMAGKKACGSRLPGFALATAATWSIHAMTNLYNRSALTEFFAVAFLTTAVAWGAMALMEGHGVRRRLWLWLAAIFGVLTVGSHPPTALVGSGFVALLAAPILALAWRRRAEFAKDIRVVVAVALLAGVTVAPWVHANLRFQKELGIVGRCTEIMLEPQRTDWVWVRLSPVPFDPEVLAKGKLAGGTPHVEASIVFALLVLGVWNAILLCRNPAGPKAGEESPARWFLILGVVWFALMLAASLTRPMADALRFLAPYVQFATRFTSHANLGLLVAVLASAALVARRGGYARHPRATIAIMTAALAISLAGVIVKLGHGLAVKEPGGEERFALRGDRTLPEVEAAKAKAALRVAFPVGARGRDFGVVREVAVELAKPGWVVTNVVAFPWSRVTVNRAEVPAAQSARAGHLWAVHLPAGRHKFAWEWRPAQSWRWLHGGSLVAGVVMLVVACVLVWNVRRRAE
jgi:hypothetical protein